MSVTRIHPQGWTNHGVSSTNLPVYSSYVQLPTTGDYAFVSDCSTVFKFVDNVNGVSVQRWIPLPWADQINDWVRDSNGNPCKLNLSIQTWAQAKTVGWAEIVAPGNALTYNASGGYVETTVTGTSNSWCVASFQFTSAYPTKLLILSKTESANTNLLNGNSDKTHYIELWNGVAGKKLIYTATKAGVFYKGLWQSNIFDSAIYGLANSTVSLPPTSYTGPIWRTLVYIDPSEAIGLSHEYVDRAYSNNPPWGLITPDNINKINFGAIDSPGAQMRLYEAYAFTFL